MSTSRPQQENTSVASQDTHDTGDTGEIAGIIMYTTSWCSDCRRAKRVFAAWNVPFMEVDIEDDEAAAERVASLNGGMRSVPTILFPDGTKLVEPSNTALEAKLAPFIENQR